jgi:HAD superfamily hydrolase (TIGR01450 family)
MNKALLIDMDGTLVNNWTPLEGSIELIDYLNKNNIPYFIITNRVSKTFEQIEENLKAVGFNILKDQIINPIIALNKYISDNGIKTYYFVGAEYQKKQLEKGDDFNKFPEYVILCDFENIDCNYSLLNKVFQYINYGSKIIATSYSNYYVSGNEYKIDTGIFVKMYELITEKKATIIGKPSTEILKIAITELKKEPNKIIIIGDDGLSDIEGGKQLGMKTILVKTGVYKEGDGGKYKPTLVINNLKEVDKIMEL